MRYTTILIKLKSPKGQDVTGQIIVRDGFALTMFSDTRLAKQLYLADLKAGLDVAYNKERRAYIQRYKGLKKDKIIEKIKGELEKAGGELLEK